MYRLIDEAFRERLHDFERKMGAVRIPPSRGRMSSVTSPRIEGCGSNPRPNKLLSK